jgi:hypothetical protein
MTTSTALFCRAALFRRHGASRTRPISWHLPIGLLHAYRCLWVGVSPRPSFAAHTHVSALAGTRRRRRPSNPCWCRTTEASVGPEIPSRPKELIIGLRREPWVALCAIRSSISMASRHPPSLRALNRTSTHSDSQNIGEAQPPQPVTCDGVEADLRIFQPCPVSGTDLRN